MKSTLLKLIILISLVAIQSLSYSQDIIKIEDKKGIFFDSEKARDVFLTTVELRQCKETDSIKTVALQEADTTLTKLKAENSLLKKANNSKNLAFIKLDSINTFNSTINENLTVENKKLNKNNTVLKAVNVALLILLCIAVI